MDKENEGCKTIWPIRASSVGCSHRVITAKYYICKGVAGAGVNITCGHPAATGAPCMWCMCPISIYEPVIKELMNTEEEDKP